MQVWLQVSAGQSLGQKFHLRGGQLARFGQSDWADFSFPDDPAMDQIQFEVRVDQQGPRLRHSGKQTQTKVNGEVVIEHALHDGDIVAAGETAFRVFIEGQAMPAADTATQEQKAPRPTNPIDLACDMLAVGKYLELDQEPLGYATVKQSPRELIAQLQQQGEYPAAVRVQAHYLPKPLAIEWGVACLKQVAGEKLSIENANLVKAVEQWLEENKQERRLTAGRMAEAAYHDGPAAMLALGVFCSEGNIGHPDHQPVLADDRITGKCVATALLQAAYLNDPTKSHERFESFLSHELLADR